MIRGKNNPDVIHITLAPGEFFFGGGNTCIHTLLGSCVAITLWHPDKHIGGMCHYLLPARGSNQNTKQGHYADDAIQLFLDEIRNADTHPNEYEVKLFGGGNMLSGLNNQTHQFSISQHNIETGRELLKQSGFSSIKATDVGGNHHRKIYLELWSGDVWVQRGRSVNKGF